MEKKANLEENKGKEERSITHHHQRPSEEPCLQRPSKYQEVGGHLNLRMNLAPDDKCCYREDMFLGSQQVALINQSMELAPQQSCQIKPGRQIPWKTASPSSNQALRHFIGSNQHLESNLTKLTTSAVRAHDAEFWTG